MVFVKSGRGGTDLKGELVDALKAASITVRDLSGKMEPKTRDEVFKSFQDGKVSVLVCTDVMCRGIDVTHTRLVRCPCCRTCELPASVMAINTSMHRPSTRPVCRRSSHRA